MHEERPSLSHRHRVITEDDLAFIRRLIAERPGSSRLALSKKLCQAWNWVQPNGALRNMVCRSLMLKRHREGHIELPPVRFVPHNPLAQRAAPALVPVEQAPLQMSLAELGPIEGCQVRRTGQEGRFNSLLQQHHYLGYTQPVDEHLKFLMVARPAGDGSAGQGRPIACAAWSSAPRHLGSRDRHIGWSAAARRANIGLLACNTRFVILPWVRVPHLASHLLGRMARVKPALSTPQYELLQGVLQTLEFLMVQLQDAKLSLQRLQRLRRLLFGATTEPGLRRRHGTTAAGRNRTRCGHCVRSATAQAQGPRPPRCGGLCQRRGG